MADSGEGEQNEQFGDDEQPQLQEEQNPVNSLPVLQYLDKTIMPDLVKGLDALTKERPEDPIEFLGNYMLK